MQAKALHPFRGGLVFCLVVLEVVLNKGASHLFNCNSVTLMEVFILINLPVVGVFTDIFPDRFAIEFPMAHGISFLFTWGCFPSLSI